MSVKLWSRLLHHQLLYTRLCALRQLSGLGEPGAQALLSGPSFHRPDESYPFVWALSRCLKSSLVSVSDQPLLMRVRFLLRRCAHQPAWRVQLGRSAAAEALVRSQHPLQTLACAVRLLEMHGAEAIPTLLELLRLPPGDFLDEQAQCVAWALGQLGRAAVPEILQEYRNASARVSRHLALALWYIGQEAVRAVPALLKDPSQQATAALLAMEEKASLAMIERGRGPVWLDQAAVQSLAEIAFSEGDRSFAASALSCFGPAAASTLPILKHLARDPRAEVRLNVARGLGWGGRPEGISILLELVEDPDKQVFERARQSLQVYYQEPEELRKVLLDTVESGAPEDRRRAVCHLAKLGLPEGADVSHLLEDETLAVDLLEALLKHPEIPLHHRPRVEQLAGQPGPARLPALRLLARWGDEPRDFWRRLLWDEPWEVAEQAALVVGRSGDSLKEWGLEREQILSLPAAVLAVLLAAMPPDRIESEDLLPLLERREPNARLAGATALRYRGERRPEVENALVAGLRDPQDAVGVACAHTLVVLGYPQHAWALLRSNRPEDRELYLGLVKELGVSPVIAEEYLSGSLYKLETLLILKDSVSLEKLAELVVEAVQRLGVQASPLHLSSLGLHGLQKIPDLLADTNPAVRMSARHALELFFEKPNQDYTEWLAQHGMQLPLNLEAACADLNQVHHLQELVLSYMHRSHLWVDPRFRPLWLHFARSPVPERARLALDAVARSYLRDPSAELEQGLLAALVHPDESVRRAALIRVGSHLDPACWRDQPSPLHEAFLFHQGQLDSGGLEAALSSLARSRLLGTQLFLPKSSQQLLALLRLAGPNPALNELIWAYRGECDGPVWSEIWRISQDSRAADFHSELALRWPRLVSAALKDRPDGVDWVVNLEPWPRAGLRKALVHKAAKVRLRALKVLARIPEGGSEFRWRLQEMASEDGHEGVRRAAGRLLSRL